MTAVLEQTSGVDLTTYDIMLDIDDVMMPWAETVHLACGHYGLHDFSKPWTQWHMWEDYGCTQEEWAEAVEQAVRDGLYVATPPLPGVVEAVNGLLWRGHRIHIVTARGFMTGAENIRRWTPEWLATFGIGYKTLTFAKNKADAMQELGVHFDFAIDDGIHNYQILDDAGVEVWLHTQPHNLDFSAERRVASLWEFAQMVHERTA